jgi:fucose 4-O-acetylase-like acetyltransferase
MADLLTDKKQERASGLKGKQADRTATTSRDYLFDNMRAILIILVVWGHLLTSMIESYDSIKMIYFFVYFFHMPAMVFISGYFSKNLDKIRSNAFETILLPYLILNVITYIYKMLIIQQPYFGFRFFRPLWGLWYLFALFVWKFFLKDLVRIRFILPLSFLVGLLSGFSKEFSEYMALGRIVCLLPFFLLGYFFRKEQVEKIRRIPKIFSVAVIAVTAFLSYYIVREELFSQGVLFLRKYFPQDQEVKYMLFRLLVYVLALAMIGALINLTGSRKSFLSRIGTGTLTIYVLHLFTIPLLEKLEILKDRPYLYLIYSLFMTALITYLYSLPLVKRIYDTIMDKFTAIIIKKNNGEN